MWLYGSGFPKSMNIGKMYDKKMGNEREYLGEDITKVKKRPKQNEKQWNCYSQTKYDNSITKGYSKFEGWGTALKPSFEPIIVARKPLDGTCVDNVIKWGVGGINIDECRVTGNDLEELQKNWTNRKAQAGFGNNDGTIYGAGVIKEEQLKEYTPDGRFPANTILTYDDTDFEEVCG